MSEKICKCDLNTACSCFHDYSKEELEKPASIDVKENAIKSLIERINTLKKTNKNKITPVKCNHSNNEACNCYHYN